MADWLMDSWLETNRLLIREWHPEKEAEAIFAIYGDPEVLAYIRPAEPDVPQAQRHFAQDLRAIKALENGSGIWAIVNKSTQEALGSILLVNLPDETGQLTSDYEIGWHLRRSAWGQGYATEAGQAIVRYGFEELNLPALYAVVRPGNQRSIHVTQRLGMTALGQTRRYYGTALLLFSLTSDQWAAQQGAASNR